MTDAYYQIYNELKTRLEMIDIPIRDSYQYKHNDLPCVVIEEINNNIDLETIDTEGVFIENVALEVNFYSKSKSPRFELKSAIEVVDDYMTNELRTNRSFSNRTPNLFDNSIYRYTIRYNFQVDKYNTVYRR